MEDNKNKVKVPGELISAGKYPVVSTDAVMDKQKGKTQEEVNEQVDADVEALQQADTNLQEQITAEASRASAKENSLDNRLSTVEELAEISVEGGTIGIASSEDFTNRTPAGDAKIPTVGAIMGSVDDEPTDGSDNLVKSGGVYEEISQLGQEVNGKQATWTNGFIVNASTLVRGSNANFKYSSPLFLKAGRAISVLSTGSGVSFVTKSNANGDFLQALLAGTSATQLEYSYTLPEDGYYVFCYKFVDASSYVNVDGVSIENMLSDDSISGRLASAEQNIDEIKQDLEDSVKYVAQIKTDEEKEIARTNINAASKDDIPVYGKQNPVIGLEGATEQNLTMFNKIVKSFIIRNIASGKDKEDVRFAQLLYNSQYRYWQIQLGYNNGSAVANLESFSISNHAIDTYQTSSFKIVVDWSELDVIQPQSTSTVFSNYTASNPYKVHFADDDKYFNGVDIKNGSINVDKISDISFDGVPTEGSDKLVHSGGIKQAIDALDLGKYGKKASVEGLTGFDQTKLTQANSIIKSIKRLENYPQAYTDARLQQIYAINAGRHSWQIQVGYVVAGQASLQDVEVFAVNNPNRTKYTSNIQHYTEIEIDWAALDSIGGTSTTLTIIYQPNVASNYYRLHFENDDKYINGSIIEDESIDEGKLSTSLQDKINSSSGILKGKKLVTLCDSLGAAGVWQAKLAELTGMVFDSNANKRYSIGGTKTLSPYMTCGQGRALQLIQDVSNNLIDTPDIILIENVNDGGWQPGTITDESFTLSNVTILDNSHKQTSRANAISYWDENKSTILGSLTPRVGTILGVPYSTQTGVKLTITHAATTDGNFGILLSDSGESVKNIAVSAGDSIETIVDKIMEYNFNAYVHEKVGTDSIVFTKSSGEAGTVTVYPNNTGITSTTTSGIEGTQAYYVYFLGHDVANWNNTANWVSEIPLYQAWKGMIEMLISAFPNAMVYWFIPKSYQFNYNASQYTRADGTPDWDAMLENDYQTYMFENQIKMAEYMNIPVLDIRQDACINPGNISVFCNNNNVHPKNAGYNRWGEVLAGMLT